MKKIGLFIILAITLTFTGCAHQMGYVQNSSALTTNNFRYVVKGVTGYSETFYILGIGGLLTEDQVKEAKDDLLRKHPLKPNQALANVTNNEKITFLGPIVIKKLSVTADIVEFNK